MFNNYMNLKNGFDRLFFFTLLVIVGFNSCEEEFIPDIVDGEQQFIVEGYIQSGNSTIPTYVLLTKSIPYFSELSQDGLNDIFVKNAIITVSDGQHEIELTHFCLDDLPDNLKPLIKSGLGLDSINGEFNFCAYVDINNEIEILENRKYDLDIQVDGNSITASTTIPTFVPLDTIWTQATPGEPLDSFSQLYCRINDPVGENYYRYKNGYVGQVIKTPLVSSIADFLFDGKKFKFPMDRAFTEFNHDEQETIAFFRTGDSIQVQWICIDKEQYDFWNTLELDRLQQGPFSSYIRAKSNVNGALGVWSGMSSKLYKIKN